jgi:hypothetical protein
VGTPKTLAEPSWIAPLMRLDDDAQGGAESEADAGREPRAGEGQGLS